MTKERFRTLVKRLHPDATGTVKVGQIGALLTVLRLNERQKKRFKHCACGVAIKLIHQRCRTCSDRARYYRLALATAIVLVSGMLALSVSAQPNIPAAAPAPTNVVVTLLYPIKLAWDYNVPAGSALPQFTTVAWGTNGGTAGSLSQVSAFGTNTCSLMLPEAEWTVRVYGTNSGTLTATQNITVARSKKMVVAVGDLAGTTNRTVYSGPPMPGDKGYLRAWHVSQWETR